MTTFRYRDVVTVMSSCRLHCQMHRTTGVVSRVAVQRPCSMPSTAASSCALGECALQTMVRRNHMRQCGDTAPRGGRTRCAPVNEACIGLFRASRKGSRENPGAHGEAQ